jgi:hypothetical protein
MAYPPNALPTDRSDATPTNGNVHADDHNNANDAINEIVTVLGDAPQGSYDSVEERLANIADDIDLSPILDQVGAMATDSATIDFTYTPGTLSAIIKASSVTTAMLAFDVATQAELDTHAALTTSVHGIADTSDLSTLSGTQTVTGTKTFSATLTATGNVAIGGTGSFGGGSKVVFIADRTTAPTTNPVAGSLLYSESGVLKVRQSNGTNFAISNTGSALLTTFTPSGLTYVTATEVQNAVSQLDAAIHTIAVTGISYPLDATFSSSTSSVVTWDVTGDTQLRLSIDASGKHLWGSGSVVGDTNLYRSAVSTLKTDGRNDCRWCFYLQRRKDTC